MIERLFLAQHDHIHNVEPDKSIVARFSSFGIALHEIVQLVEYISWIALEDNPLGDLQEKRKLAELSDRSICLPRVESCPWRDNLAGADFFDWKDLVEARCLLQIRKATRASSV
jgi:hypothetical protein